MCDDTFERVGIKSVFRLGCFDAVGSSHRIHALQNARLLCFYPASQFPADALHLAFKYGLPARAPTCTYLKHVPQPLRRHAHEQQQNVVHKRAEPPVVFVL